MRYFAHERGMELMVTQSYSKNFGLYGERIGALNVVCKDQASAVKVQSQLGLIVRGFQMEKGVDFDDSFSPTPGLAVGRFMLSRAARLRY